MSYDLMMVSFTYLRDNTPRGDEASIMRHHLAPYCDRGPCLPQDVESGMSLVSPTEEWGSPWVTGLDDQSLGVNRPPLWDLEFVTLIFSIAREADCFFLEVGKGVYIVVNDDQYDHLQARGWSPLVLARSPQELSDAYHTTVEPIPPPQPAPVHWWPFGKRKRA